MIDIANKKIGISKETLYQWKRAYPDFADALSRGKELADIEVENALYKRAIGFEYEETVQEVYKDIDGVDRQHIRKYRKYMPPDTVAMKYWLTCRRPDKWREGKEINLDISDNSFNNTLLRALQGAAQEALPTDIPENAELETETEE